MATANKVFVSPGVYTSERDLSFVTQSVGVTTLGIVGETLTGPAFEPIFITNYDEFETYFGGTLPEKFVNTQIPKYEAAYIAKSYLQQSNQLFVTRILGLSGYDAGPSWSIVTQANPDKSKIGLHFSCTTIPNYSAQTCDIDCVECAFSFSVPFSGCNGQFDSIEFLGSFPQEIQSIIDNPYTEFDGGISTLSIDIKSQLLSIISNNSLSANSINYYGTIPTDDYNSLSSTYTASTNVFNVAGLSYNSANLEASQNDVWYYSLFTPVPDSYMNFSGCPLTSCVPPSFDTPVGDYYGGFSFWNVVTGLTLINPIIPTTTTTTIPTPSPTPNPCLTPTQTPSVVTTTSTYTECFSGNVVGVLYYYSGVSYSDYNDLVIATLRSRGLSSYNTSDNGPDYEVQFLSGVTLDFSGSYSSVTKNPYSVFEIDTVDKNGDEASFKVSFTSGDATYLPKVLGGSNFDKSRFEVPIFLEERYQSMLNYGYRKGFIRGLKKIMIQLPESRNSSSDSIGFYLERYQSPESPWVVSELRGNKVYKLFKFITISDGNSANSQVKISLSNMSFENLTFDVIVRNYFDTDDSPVVLEKFTNCGMDPGQNNFVGVRIGTQDGEYALNSKYVMIELNEEAPIDSIPCGFEGFETRTYIGGKSPFPIYKTKYNFPGEQVYNPPFGTLSGSDNVTFSPGDNPRKVYLGISNTIGIDNDFYQYKGKQNPLDVCFSTTGSKWATVTKGFHMDKNASAITINNIYYDNVFDPAIGSFIISAYTSPMSQFEVGSAEFSNDPESTENPYYRLFARHFSLLVQGGFDGWDIYREFRTNRDNFMLGSTGYLRGSCPTIRYPQATGWGSFKQITVGDVTGEFANTDYYAYLLGILTFRNPEAVNINVFVTPGIDYVNNSNLVESAIDMIENERADSIYICTTPDYNMYVPSSTIESDFIYPEEVVDNLTNTGIDSNYTATYYPWVLTRDTVNNTQIYIPATAEVTRNLALTDNIAFPWFASAGYTRGLVNAIKARRKLTQEDRDTLYNGRINPIATFNDVGTVIWGNKTLQIRQSALDRLNVRRLLLQARKLISAVAVRLLFEQNDSKVRQDFLDAVNPILDGIRRDRGLYDFRVSVSSSPEDLDANQLVGKIYIKPTKSLEFIDIEFLITPTGASFENI